MHIGKLACSLCLGAVLLAQVPQLPKRRQQAEQMGMEEDAAVDAAGKADWVGIRQTEFHLVR